MADKTIKCGVLQPMLFGGSHKEKKADVLYKPGDTIELTEALAKQYAGKGLVALPKAMQQPAAEAKEGGAK